MDHEGLSNHAKEFALYPKGSGKLLNILMNSDIARFVL